MNMRPVVLHSVLLAMSVLPLYAATVERVFRPERYSRGDTNVRVQQPIDEASWIWAKGYDVWGGAVFSETRTSPEALAKMPQSFFRFRRDFTNAAETLEFDVSADERFVLLLDGEEIARGPMRGLPKRWHYQSYRVAGLEPGAHRLEAVCWQIGEHAPLAQVSIRGGFILKAGGAYDAQLTTGKAAWKVAPLANTRMTHKGKSGAFGVGSQCEVRGTGLLDEVPDDAAWQEAVVVRGPVDTWAGLVVQGWMLFPSPLRDMMREAKTPGAVKRGFDVLKPGAVVPANTKVTAWWDLGNYYCAYPRITVSGGKGAAIHWDWAECLTGPDGKKGDRAAFGEGLDMPNPFGDVFLCDGRANARFTTPWWRCGRWCRLTIETKDAPLEIGKVEIVETRYPVEMSASFDCDDPFIMKMQPVCARSLQMCMHEMFFDCPYYEQQMYPGDSRVQYLVSGLFDTEDRMVRNAITLYDTDRRENGMIPMNCPTRGTQDALGFTCCEAMMFGDYAWNHANRGWLKARLPGLNHTLMGMEDFLNEDGLLGKTPGWNFVDWVWKAGVPPDGDVESPNAEINLQYLHAILSAVIAEEAIGDATLAAHWRARAERLKAAIRRAFWCGDRALFASNVAKTEFSEHSQCLALLADVVTGEDAERCFKALVETPGLARGTIYYKHYLFSTYFKFHRADLFFGNLGFWRNCIGWNLSTILETPEINSRSDCHGWGSHPLWHLHTGVAGVKSAAPFYEKVLVEPQPAHLKRIRSTTPTPKGDVKLDLSFDAGKTTGTVVLPEGLYGTFRWNGEDRPLSSGVNHIQSSAEPGVKISAESFGPLTPSAKPCEREYIWPEGKMPDVQPHQVAAKTGEKDALGFKPTDFLRPYIDWYAPNPECRTDLCVITVSGGGFEKCCDAERLQPAIDRFVKAGITVADVTYRTPRPRGLPIHQSAWEDLERAVRVVRSQAAKRGFDPAKIGATGISAGAKAVLLVATSSQTRAYEPVDEIDDIPCNLLFAIPQAPAYVLTDGSSSPNTRGGDGSDVQLVPELKFDEKTCPMCFFQGGIDEYSPLGTTMMYRRLRSMKIPAEVHLFADRWHGFHGDMNKGDDATGWDHWFHRAEEFIRQMNYDGRLGGDVALMKRFPDDSACGEYAKEEIWPAGRIPDMQADQCVPYIEWHMPKVQKAKGIQIIFSGGGYKGSHPDGFEVAPARRYLNEKGVAVVTLKYRTPRPSGGLAKHTSAWQDLQRAIRKVRSEAPSKGLDPNRIGIMGSSAGGHLALLGATSSRRRTYLPIDEIDALPCKVQWAVAVYPAYALTDGIDGYNANGGNADDDRLVADFSFDMDTCPVLFIHGDSDGFSAMASVKAWEQLRRMGVQGEVHTLATRPHCFQASAAPGTGSYTFLDRIWEFMNHRKAVR